MKIIDYFAAGIAVVSTSKGIEGIPVTDGQQARIIDDWDQLAQAVAQLLRNDQERLQLAESARELAQTLDWTQLGKRYLNTYRRNSDH